MSEEKIIIISILFSKRDWTEFDAEKWLVRHGYESEYDVYEGSNYYEYIINDVDSDAKFYVIPYGNKIKALVSFA